MNNPFNKNSAYIQSLVDFILDTKPYHSKLTEVVEEYQFFDSMNVKFSEANTLKVKVDSVQLFNYFSGGNGSLRTLNLSRVISPFGENFPLNTDPALGRFKAFRDEAQDLQTVPFVFSKQTFDGPGPAEVLIERNGVRSAVEAMLEGHDYFTSHGAFQALIKQTTDANTNFVPSWVMAQDDVTITTASFFTRILANTVSNPASASAKILVLLQQIQSQLTSAIQIVIPPGGDPVLQAQQDARDVAQAQLTALIAQVGAIVPTSTIQLPNDYELLLNSLTAGNVAALPGFVGWVGQDAAPFKYVSEELSRLSPSLYFNMFSEHSSRESGAAQFDTLESRLIEVFNIVPGLNSPVGETWWLVPISTTAPTFSVISALTGFIGTVLAGTSFASAQVSFSTSFVAQATTADLNSFRLSIKPTNRIVFDSTAPLEAWSVIKVNPLAYTRPIFSSNSTGSISSITILDLTLPTGAITLTAVDSSTFSLSSSVESYTATVQVGVLFNDGRLSFIISAGTVPFVAGDKFFIPIVNQAASYFDLDLGYGYDLDSYDNQGLASDVPGQPINFAFASRFSDYDLSQLNLTVQQSAVSGRSWRLVAIPDLTAPIATIKKDASVSNFIDLQDATTGVPPDVALTAAPLYSMLGDANPAPDLQLFYATHFNLEYSDDDFNTVTSVSQVEVGQTFTGSGISFTLAPGSKPFIAVINDNGLTNPAVEGGDIISFRVENPNPYLAETPTLVSSGVARLVLHGDGFHESPPANWTISFTSPTEYQLQGVINEGPSTGQTVYPTPIEGSLAPSGLVSAEGQSYQDDFLHFSIRNGASPFVASDVFTFSTFSKKPSYLVHGSVSGWQEPAIVGEPYWNGIIGFTIEAPKLRLFNQALPNPLLDETSEQNWTTIDWSIAVSRVRFDAPALVYSLEPLTNFIAAHPAMTTDVIGWSVYRSDIGYVGFLPLLGQLKDTYLTLVSASTLAIPLKLQVIADDFELPFGQDTIILNPVSSPRLPTANDFVLIDKRRSDTLSLNLNYSATTASQVPSLSALRPVSIDPLFIDTSTASLSYPLLSTSPETAILQNWIPLRLIGRDSASSDAAFSDQVTTWNIKSMTSDIDIGTLELDSATPNSPAKLTWDPDFFARYLPLNTESNLIVQRSGFNDRVSVRIIDTARFLISGGALTTDFFFKDSFNVVIDEANQLAITMDQIESVGVAAADGPFIGFLPGYSNLPYDDEPDGYDTGVPLTDFYHEANQLTSGTLSPAQVAMTPAERADRLAYLTMLLQPFLVGGDLASTSYETFQANIDSAYPLGLPTAAEFGIPLVGLGIDITIGRQAAVDLTQPSTNNAAAQIQDSVAIRFKDDAFLHDAYGYGQGGLDSDSNESVLLQITSALPIPSATPVFTTYAEFETQVKVVGSEDGDFNQLEDSLSQTDFQARVFLFSFTGSPAMLAAMPTPIIGMWRPLDSAPFIVNTVEKIKDGLYRITVAQPTEAKFYLS